MEHTFRSFRLCKGPKNRQQHTLHTNTALIYDRHADFLVVDEIYLLYKHNLNQYEIRLHGNGARVLAFTGGNGPNYF